MINERPARRALIMIALAGLSIGLVATFAGHNGLARRIWAAGRLSIRDGAERFKFFNSEEKTAYLALKDLSVATLWA